MWPKDIAVNTDHMYVWVSLHPSLQQYIMSSYMWRRDYRIVYSLLIILLISRNGTKNGIESPVWRWGRLVWQRRTPRSRTGIINPRNSSLNHAPMKPVYVHAFYSCYMMHLLLNVYINIFVLPLQYLGSMLIKDLRGTESTQDACAKMRVCHESLQVYP